MSDGRGESGREFEHNCTKNTSGSDDFVQAIAKIAVAQVCESAGFQGFQQSALDKLSNVAVRYIHDLGKNANLYANLAGRTEGNVFDIIQGLEDLGLSQGFPGASEINRCLARSGTVREIAQYVSVAEEVSFAYSIPSFPVIKDRNPTPSFVQAGETPPDEHIPHWLPAFPDLETYTHFPAGSEREADIRTGNIEQVKEHRKVEQSLVNMRQRMAYNGSEALTVVDPGDASKAKLAAYSNPFLATPLRFGEKEVSSVVLPAKLSNEYMMQNHADGANHVSVLDTFAPAIESIKNSVCDSEEGRKKVLLNRRSTVQFKLGAGKKSPGTSTSLRNKGIVKITSLFENDNVKDDKKRRAEKILKESMENPQELAQL